MHDRLRSLLLMLILIAGALVLWSGAAAACPYALKAVRVATPAVQASAADSTLGWSAWGALAASTWLSLFWAAYRWGRR